MVVAGAKTRNTLGPDPREAGFTLIELMVAFALMGLLIMIMGGGVRFGVRVWEASQLRADAMGEIQAIRGFMRERTLAMRPVRQAGADRSQKAIAFQGSARDMEFVTLMPSYVTRGGLYHVAFGVSDDGASDAITMRWWPYGGGQTGPGTGQRRLMEGIKELKISYFGNPENTGDDRWQDTWSESATLPRLVSIKLAFPEGDHRVWPELMVALPASAPRTNARRNN
jgi:general secretion pathway protein J